MTAKPRRGRPSRAEELSAFAEAAGIDMQTVGDYLADKPVVLREPGPEPEPEMPDIDDPAELEAWAKQMLMAQAASGKASVAMVNALKALVEMARKQGPRDDGEVESLPLLERAHALPPEIATGLIREEISRLDALRAAYFERLEEIGALNKV